MDELNFVTFFYILDEIIKENPNVYVNIKRLRNNGRWRIQVFGSNQAVNGDSELLYVEDWDKDKAFLKAATKLDEIKKQINNLNNNARKEQ